MKLYTKINSILFPLILRLYSRILRKIIKIDSSVVIFTSMPDFSDNSLAISDYLQEHGYTNQYKIYWCVKNAKYFKRKFPKQNVTFFQTDGWYAFINLKLYFKASWIFATHGYVCYDGIPTNPGQHLIRLWHGCSYKDKDILTKKKKQNKPPFEKALVAGPLFVKTKSYFWDCPESMIIAKGYPRYDWLKKKEVSALALYNQIKGSSNKLVIWMPTYRVDKSNSRIDTNHITQFPLMKNKENWNQLDAICQDNNITIAVKLHPMQKTYEIDWTSFRNIKEITNEQFYDAGTTLYKFLATTDGLISDYSSVAVDYMIVDKPIAFTLDDYELYKNGRGFVVKDPRIYMPGYHLYKLEDLYHYLSDLAKNMDVYKKDRDQVFDALVYRSNNYCQEILKTIGFIK